MKDRCISEPNLPNQKVTLAAVSEQLPNICAELTRLGVSCLTVTAFSCLAEPVCSHADMLCHPMGGEKVLIARGNKHLFLELKKAGFYPEETQKNLMKEYPGDILLNAAQIGSYCFASRYCDEKLQESFRHRKIFFVPVRQGYAKCSTVIVSKKAILTADPSIAAAAKQCGFDVLRVQAGFVELPGYPYGFLGGACGKLSADTLAFTGDLSTHPDHEAIVSFLRNYRVYPVCLQQGPLQDIGGILPLSEEEKAEK